ncbi:MAG: hypothetical protein CR217_06940 [Beijerinckiaceae bacterium]|nr:MAG: hypothetical protein CR217_06940 [Beijerinckiaceae bacterium]
MILKMFHVKHFSSSLKPFAKLFGATQSPAFFRLILKMFHVKHFGSGPSSVCENLSIEPPRSQSGFPLSIEMP